MKKVAFYTLGCKLNFSESSTIARQMEGHGFTRTSFTDSPDIYIINTCSVTDHADRKCKKVVEQARAINPNAFVAIIGCYAQLKPTEIANIQGVDAVLGAAEKFRLPELLGTFERPKQAQVMASPIAEANTFINGWSSADRTRTFLKVQDGCNYNCSFCTIPLARGKSRSGTIASVVAEAHKIAATGVKEVVITGVNVGDFGIIDGKRQERFFDLVKALDEVEGIARFRISSIEPNLLSDEIIAFVASSNKLVPHFHIPLQSGSDELLTAMRRRYRTKLYRHRIAYIKEVMPNACIGVDILTGFPGETDELFLETYNFLNQLPISYLHVFPYSERANTAAIDLPEKVVSRISKERALQLRNLSEKKKRAFYAAQKGSSGIALFEHDVKDGLLYGFTENYVRVVAPYNPLLVNELTEVEIGEQLPEGMVAVKILEPQTL